MIVEKQNKGECLLSSVAAISGKTLAEVREIALMTSGKRDWSKVYGKDFWNSVYTMSSQFNSKTEKLIKELYYCAIGSKFLITGSTIKTIPDNGKGIVTVRYNEYFRHSMPFENGMVFDPESPEFPLTMDEWNIANPGWEIEFINTLD